MRHLTFLLQYIVHILFGLFFFLNQEFKGEKPVQWPVSESALKSIASLRLQQLSRPLSRALIRDDYDPYKVSSAARKARVTPRLELLSAPIPRKVKQKKII